jgi:hypothetical protein
LIQVFQNLAFPSQATIARPDFVQNIGSFNLAQQPRCFPQSSKPRGLGVDEAPIYAQALPSFARDRTLDAVYVRAAPLGVVAAILATGRFSAPPPGNHLDYLARLAVLPKAAAFGC